MAMTPEKLAALAALNREKGDDQTQTAVGGTYVREVPEEGVCMLRLVGYVELGQHPEEFKDPGGKVVHKTPNKVMLEWEVRGAKWPAENEETGRKTPFIIRDTMTLSNSDRANFHKLFHALRGGDENVKHMIELLGKPFIGVITHGKSADGKTTYANLKSKKEGYQIKPAFKEDVDFETSKVTRTPIKVPPAITPLRTMLWDFADAEQWESLFIDGTSKPKTNDQGEVIEEGKSLNWIQNMIRRALNYKGSPVDAVDQGASPEDLDLDEPERPARSGQTDEDALASAFGGQASAPNYDLNDDIPF